MTLVKVNNPVSKSFDGLLNDLFNEFPSSFGKTVRKDVFGFPPVNIVENGNKYELQVAAPGFEKKDFSIKVEDKLLTISAENKVEQNDETLKTIRKEFSQKAFKRNFTIDEKIDSENIIAKYENGVLFVELPKKEIVKEGKKEITIQ